MSALAQDLTPTPTPEAALAAARGVRAEAHSKLATATAKLQRARETAADFQREADRLSTAEAAWIERHSRKIASWISADGRGPRPLAAADVEVAAAQMSARANAAAASEALARFEAAEREAADALKRADAHVLAAAQQVLFAEIRAEFEAFRRQASEMAATREHLFAAYLSEGRGALDPRQWLELDTLNGFTSDVMEIGSAWVEIPIHELELTGGRDRPKEARRRINALIPQVQTRLAALASERA